MNLPRSYRRGLDLVKEPLWEGHHVVPWARGVQQSRALWEEGPCCIWLMPQGKLKANETLSDKTPVPRFAPVEHFSSTFQGKSNLQSLTVWMTDQLRAGAGTSPWFSQGSGELRTIWTTRCQSFTGSMTHPTNTAASPILPITGPLLGLFGLKQSLLIFILSFFASKPWFRLFLPLPTVEEEMWKNYGENPTSKLHLGGVWLLWVSLKETWWSKKICHLKQHPVYKLNKT